MKLLRYFLAVLISIFLSSCGGKSNVQNFKSKYNYSVNLLEYWSEYDTNEKNTDAFFNTTKWTGNLRITPIDIEISPTAYLNKNLIEKNAENIDWENIKGIYYYENTDNKQIHYWYLIENKRLYICSFTIGHIKGKKDIETEINNIDEILKSIKSN